MGCVNRCTFCRNNHLREKFQNCQELSESIAYSKTEIENNFIISGNNPVDISLIGGEFYQHEDRFPEYKHLMMNFLKWFHSLMEKGQLRMLYLNASLLGHIQGSILDCFLKEISPGMRKNVGVNTSWDAAGRFNSEMLTNIWESNMTYLRESYENLFLHIQTILTGDLIDLLKQKPNTFHDLSTKWNCAINLFRAGGIVGESKEDTLKRIPGFFPKRKDVLGFFLFMLKTNKKNAEIINTCFNHDLRANYTILSFKKVSKSRNISLEGEDCIYTSPTKISDCGHPTVCRQAYADSDCCIQCDYENLCI